MTYILFPSLLSLLSSTIVTINVVNSIRVKRYNESSFKGGLDCSWREMDCEG